MSDRARDVDWEGCVNGRDLGGLGSVRRAAVVRMEAPDRLTASGWAAAETFGVRTVIDLRDDGERTADLASRPASVTTVHVPLDPVGTPFYERWTKIDDLASPLYYPGMLAEHPDRVVAVVRAIATAEPGCVVVHCAAGKDRTGLISLVLLRMAGAAPAAIVADYLRTFERFGALDRLDALRELLARHRTTVEDSLRSTIESLTMPDYLLDHGLSAAELDALRARLLDPPR